VTTADGTRILRAYGLTPHPNVLGGFLACGLVVLMSASTTSRAARLAQGAIVVLATAALVVTFSRGAWLAGLTGLVVGLAILAGSGSGRPVRRWLTTAALALAVVAAIGWLAREPIASRTWLAPTITGTEQRSIDERLEQIRLGWRVMLERPVTGAGASAVPIAMRQLEPDFPYAFYAPHLVVLTVAGELGVAGGLAYAWLMAAPWALLAAARRRWTVELAGASAALAALTVVSLFDDYPWVGGPGRTLAWLVIGLWAVAWSRANRDHPAEVASHG
jgi:putative inorganic carbon (HCO3(-)) transporter